MPTETPRVPPDAVVYAIGDIHGRRDLLDRLHDLIRDDAADRDCGRRVIVYLGDYVDRGPDSAGVIDSLCDAPLPGFETIHLIGNHEDYMKRFLVDPSVGPAWFWNGGGETLESYDIDVSGADGPGALPALRDALAAAVPAAHRRFLERLSSYHVEGDYAFVHAGVRPGRALENQRREDLIWIREDFLDSTERHDRIIVHGHTIARAPQWRSNRIGIDTGAFATGVLTALVLEGAERTILQTTG